MKRWKKLAAMLLAMAMAVSMLCVSAFAADDDTVTPPPTYTITINNTASGHTYGAYQILSGKLTQNKTSSQPILADIDWGKGVKDSAELLKALQADGTIGADFADAATASDVAKVLSGLKEDTKVKVFAKVAAKYLSDQPQGMSTRKTGNNSGYEITGLYAGYYLVKDMNSTGIDYQTDYILNLVNNITVSPKGDSPKVIKKVAENTKVDEIQRHTDSNMPNYTIPDEYNDAADYGIGDKVPFLLVGSMPSNIADYETYTYIFHDTMDKGLTFNADSVTVTVDGKQIQATVGEHTNYTVVTDETDNGHTFDVKFSNVKNLVDESGKTIPITAKTKIEVRYNATLNRNANIGLPGNVNAVYLEYSNNPNGEGTGETPKDKVIVFTYRLDVTKTNEGNTNLEGAQFILYKEVNSETLYYAKTDDQNIISDWTTNIEEAKTFTSDDKGLFSIIGLDDGTYYLKETVAPDGYNTLEKPIKFTISAETVHTQDWDGLESGAALKSLDISIVSSMDAVQKGTGDTTDGSVSMTVKNKIGSTLPSTGGIGTTIFYVVGGLLMAGAAVLLIVKKRMSK